MTMNLELWIFFFVISSAILRLSRDYPFVTGGGYRSTRQNHRLSPSHWQLSHMCRMGFEPGQLWETVSGNALDHTALTQYLRMRGLCGHFSVKDGCEYLVASQDSSDWHCPDIFSILAANIPWIIQKDLSNICLGILGGEHGARLWLCIVISTNYCIIYTERSPTNTPLSMLPICYNYAGALNQNQKESHHPDLPSTIAKH